MKSEHMFLLLSNFSGLKLHEQAPSDTSDDDDEDSEKEDNEEGEGEDEEKRHEGKETRERKRSATHGKEGNVLRHVHDLLLMVKQSFKSCATM